MFDFLESLRQKDTRTKHVIAFVTSGIITLAIAGVWATVFMSSRSEQKVATKAELQRAAVSEAIRATQSPLSTIREQTTRAFRNIKEQFTSTDLFVAPAAFPRGE